MRLTQITVGALLVLLPILGYFVYELNRDNYEVKLHAVYVDHSTAVKLLRHCMKERGVLTESMKNRSGKLVRVQCRAYIYEEEEL